uniref:B30.2/SPRY domain-containing protein n=1 Tax=Globodera rostochiensis TaxID=31243 RepID=A0A914I629_GLORO
MPISDDSTNANITTTAEHWRPSNFANLDSEELLRLLRAKITDLEHLQAMEALQTKVKELETDHRTLQEKVVKLEEYQKEMLLRMDEFNRQQTMNSPTLSSSFDLVALNESEDKATDAEQLLPENSALRAASQLATEPCSKIDQALQANGVTEMKYRKLLIDHNVLQALLIDHKAEIAEMKRRLNPQQNRWDSAARHRDLALTEPDRLIVQHNGRYMGDYSVLAERQIPKENVGIFYYEMTMLRKKGRVHIGLGTTNQRPLIHIGHDEGSYAYGSGGYFWGHEVAGCDHSDGRPFIREKAKFEQGDVIGCGINLATRQIIYTKNGQRLETAGLFVSSAVELFPCLTLFYPGDKIEANFGPNFNFKEFGQPLRSTESQQNRWDSVARHWELAIIEPDRLIVLHNGGGSPGCRTVFGVEPIPKENVGGIFYYEVKILEKKSHLPLHIGLGDKQMRPFGDCRELWAKLQMQY